MPGFANAGSEWGRVVAGALSFFAKGTGTEFFRLGSGTIGLGAAEDATIVSGVLTVTKPYVHVLPESSTSDQLDSIVYAAANEGDFLLLTPEATNTITVDDAAINLGAATRVMAPGGSILLQKDGAGVWTERAFTASGDNA